MLRPDGHLVRFTYDALGRRLSKHYRGQVTRWCRTATYPCTSESRKKGVQPIVKDTTDQNDTKKAPATAVAGAFLCRLRWIYTHLLSRTAPLALILLAEMVRLSVMEVFVSAPRASKCSE